MMTAADITIVDRALKRALSVLAHTVLKPRDMVMIRIGMRAMKIEQALSRGEGATATGDADHLVELSRQVER